MKDRRSKNKKELAREVQRARKAQFDADRQYGQKRGEFITAFGKERQPCIGNTLVELTVSPAFGWGSEYVIRFGQTRLAGKIYCLEAEFKNNLLAGFHPGYDEPRESFWWSRRVPSEQAMRLLRALKGVRLGVMPRWVTVLDGVGYELEIHLGDHVMGLKWNSEPPVEWKELRPVVQMLKQMANGRAKLIKIMRHTPWGRKTTGNARKSELAELEFRFLGEDPPPRPVETETKQGKPCQ